MPGKRAVVSELVSSHMIVTERARWSRWTLLMAIFPLFIGESIMVRWSDKSSSERRLGPCGKCNLGAMHFINRNDSLSWFDINIRHIH